MDEHTLINMLSEILLSRQNGRITGSQLGDLLLAHFSDFNIRQAVNMPTGPGALSKFIDTRLSDILLKDGKSGADLVYSILRKEKIRQDGLRVQNGAQPAAGGAKNSSDGNNTKNNSVPENYLGSEIESLRKIINYAVNHMSIDQLRAISLPAGIVYDAIKFAGR